MNASTHCITQIEIQKNDDARVSIYLNGSYAFGLKREIAAQYSLHEGDELTDSMIENVLLAEEIRFAKEKALRFLSARSHSVFEIKKKLKDRDVSCRSIERVVQDFLRVGLLDDVKFTEGYVHSRLIGRPMGRRLLEIELKKKGIAEGIIEDAVSRAFQATSERFLALRLVEGRIKRYRGQEELRVKKKISDFLCRRGFGWDVVYDIVQQIPEILKQEE